MDIAERYGELLRRLLLSADRFSEAAICFGSFNVKTLFSRSSALLCLVTYPDQRLPDFRRVFCCAIGFSSQGSPLGNRCAKRQSQPNPLNPFPIRLIVFSQLTCLSG